MKLDEVLGRLNGVKKTASNQFMARCPAHEDSTPSLAISSSKGKIIMKCLAGCDIHSITAAIGLDVKDLFEDKQADGKPWRFIREHIYRNADGEIFGKKMLYDKGNGDKTGVWYRYSGGSYIKGLSGQKAPLYNLPELINSSGTVYFAEGEKDVDTLEKMGFVATSLPNGGGEKWRDEFNNALTEREIVVLTDNDKTGRTYGQIVSNGVMGVAASVRMIPATAIYPDIKTKGDISDIAAKFGIVKAREMLEAALPMPDIQEVDTPQELERMAGGYSLKDGRLYQDIAHSENADNKQELKYLLNGWIEATGEVTHDNGIDVDRVLNLTFHCCNGKDIQSETSFADLQSGKFLTLFGMDCRPAVGSTKKNYIADSILAQSDNTPRKTVFLQTGWRRINGKWCFLHGGGAIGAENITVELSGRNSQYCFPASESAGRHETLQRFFKVAPDSIVFPLLAITFLSPLNEPLRRAHIEPAFVVFLQGVTGSMKSTLAALCLNFYGEAFGNKALPMSFRDTSNSIEKNGFLLADVLTVIDDLYPCSNRAEAAKMAQTAQSISRSWGDRTGRSRMNADTSLRQGYAARGNALLTGEDSPQISQSGAARNFVLELKKGDVQLTELSYLQAHTVHLAEVMRDYIVWLCPQMNTLPEALKARFQTLRNEAQQEGHGRTIEAIAHLQIAVETFTRFLVDRGEMDVERAGEMQRESWRVFNELAAEQGRRIEQDKPTKLFLDALKELIETKTYNIAELDSNMPFEYEPDKLIGYSDSFFAYLYPETAYKVVKQFYAQSERNFPLSKNQLYKHLNIEHLIEAGDGQTTKQKNIKGKNSRWLWLRKSSLEVAESDTPRGYREDEPLL